MNDSARDYLEARRWSDGDPLARDFLVGFQPFGRTLKQIGEEVRTWLKNSLI